MKKTTFFAIVGLFAIVARGQDLQTGEMYIPILNGTQNPVNITVAVLNESTPQERTFLAALAAAPKKATFICDNLTNQGFTTMTFTSPTIAWSTRSTNWPQIQTVVLCGTIALREHVNYQDVTNQYTFGGWGSVQLQSNLKLQGALAGLNFTDYCPAYPQSLGANCETSQQHPAPPALVGTATLRGTVTIELGLRGVDSLTALSSWGASQITLAFVPDSDRSTYADALRNGNHICSAIDDAVNDPSITIGHSDESTTSYGKWPNDTQKLDYTMTIPNIEAPGANGSLFACTGDLQVKYTTTSFTSEPFQPVQEIDTTHDYPNYEIWWHDVRVTVRPDHVSWKNLSTEKTVYPGE